MEEKEALQKQVEDWKNWAEHYKRRVEECNAELVVARREKSDADGMIADLKRQVEELLLRNSNNSISEFSEMGECACILSNLFFPITFLIALYVDNGR